MTHVPLRLALAMACLAIAASCVAPVHSAPGPPPETERADAGGALEWRLMTMRNADGSIPADGIVRARAHMDRMRLHAGQLQSAQMATSAALLSNSSWRWLGPGNIGGRVRSIVISPTNTQTLFAGSVAGGIWRSDDGGQGWRPVDDFMASLAVSSLLIDPADPNVMYAGTGEVYANGDALPGAGVFKSTDAGTTWTQLPATANNALFTPGVSRLAMSPSGQVLLAAAGGMGGAVFRSTDGGASFTQTSFADGVDDVRFDPSNGSNAIAAGYGAVFYSRDGGVTWQPSTLSPAPSQIRLETSYAPSQPNIVYLATADGAIYASTDGGVSFSQRSTFGIAQGWYNLALWVNPANANHLIVGAVTLYESTDGGSTTTPISNGSIHVDHHVIVADPHFDNATDRTVYFGNDGGVFRADVTPGGPYQYTSLVRNLGITQFYGAAGNATSGQIVGGTQDNGTLLYNPQSGTAWSQILDGDGGVTASDPTNPAIFYGEYPNLQIVRFNNGNAKGISGGITGGAYFIAPLILDPNNANRMLAGGHSLWRTNDVTDTSPIWTAIKAPIAAAGAISAIAVAQGNPDDIWVAYGDGDVYQTVDGTSPSPTWTKVYSTNGYYVNRVTIDPANASVVYVSVGGFAPGNIQRTDDGGTTWVSAAGSGDTGLPAAPVRDVLVDPFDSSTIYAGTEVGLFLSHDRGGTWALPQDGPANVSVDQLFLMGSTLVAATHGRGLFAADLNQQGSESVAIAPNQVDFGPQQVHTDSPTQHVVVTNSGSAAVTVQSVAVASGHVDSFYAENWGSCAGVALAPGGSCGFDVFFSPQQPGSLEAVVQVMSTAPGSPHQIALTGTGTASTLQPGWIDTDVGAVGAAGSAASSNGTFTVQGSGADVWGTADAFNFAYVPLSGDGTIIARVATVSSEANWVKAGVMIRNSLSPSSAQAFMLVSHAKGVAFQRRTSDGNTSVSTSGTLSTAPWWVKLVRRGSTISAYESPDGATWTLVGSDSFTLGTSALMGLAVSSHVPGTLATAMFDNVTAQHDPPSVSITSPSNGATFIAPASISISASASATAGIEDVRFTANGTPIGGAATPPYTITWNNVPAGTYTLVAAATDNSGATTTSSAVSITVSPAPTGLPDGWTDADVGAVGAAGSASYDSGTFTVMGSGADVWGTADAFNYAYLPLSGDGTIVARVATISNEANWVKAGVMIRGSLSPSSAQAFMLVSWAKGVVFQRRTADGNTSVSTAGSFSTAPLWVKLVRAGSLITAYESSDGSAWTVVGSDTFAMGSNAFIGLAVSSHVAGTLSTATFDNVTSTATPPVNQPPTVSLTNPSNGSTFTAPATISIEANAGDSDGTVTQVDFYANSTLLGTSANAPYTLAWSNVPAAAYNLTAVATDNDGATTTSAVVGITVNDPTSTLPNGWADSDIGAVPLAGGATYSGGTFTITGSGTDVWGTADQFHYAYQTMTGDGTIVARVVSIQNVSSWVKAGVMIRETLDPASTHAFMLVSAAKGAPFQRREVTGGTSVSTSGSLSTAPYWVKLTRTGDTFSAYESSDGVTWTLVGTDAISMASTVYVGLAVTSHNTSASATCTFDNVSIQL